LGCHRQPLGGRVDQHKAKNGTGMARGVGSNDETAKGMPHKDVSLSRRDTREHRWELIDNLLEASGTWSYVAPRQTGTIVRTCPRERRDLWLHDRPTKWWRGNAGFEQHDWAAAPPADYVQAMTAHVNQPSGRPELPAMPPGGDSLIEGAERKERYDKSKNGHLPIVRLRPITTQPRAIAE
jgi:hypothetical protein